MKNGIHPKKEKSAFFQVAQLLKITSLKSPDLCHEFPEWSKPK